MLCLLVTFVTFVCFLLLLKLKRPKSKNISSGIHLEYGWILNDQNNLIKKRNTCFKFSCKFNKPLYIKKNAVRFSLQLSIGAEYRILSWEEEIIS